MRLSLILVGASFAISPVAFGDNFSTNCPGATLPCNETVNSLGTFIINVAPAFQPYFAGVPGYDPVSHIFLSPLLSDPNTMVGLSAPFLNSGSPVSGVTIGTGANALANQSTPGVLPSGFSQTAGNDTILTALQNLDLTGGGISVTAGAAAPSGTPTSNGEVQANQNASDFPAFSFFDVFVDISLPGGFGSFHNSTPLIVESPSVTTLPPTVVYVHGGGLAPVSIIGDTNNASFAGDSLGTFMLAGHGVNFNTTPQDEAAFDKFFAEDVANDSDFNQEERNFVDRQLVPEPASWTMLFSELVLIVVFAGRRISQRHATKYKSALGSR
jgi:hypothetical protein